MKRLHELTPEQILNQHRSTPLRVYEYDSDQQGRIQRSRNLVLWAIKAFPPMPESRQRRKIIELGAGACDISGWFSWGHDVHAYESSQAATEHVAKRWPYVKQHHGDLHEVPAEDCDILILCEILEHLPDPLKICREWMPRAGFVIISSPFNGDLNPASKCAEHVWSFDNADFQQFFKEGHQRILRSETFKMGGYEDWVGISRREADFPKPE